MVDDYKLEAWMKEPRKTKICYKCIHHVPETPELRGECLEEEDIESEDFCESFVNEKDTGV